MFFFRFSIKPLLAVIVMSFMTSDANAQFQLGRERPNIIYIMLDDAGYGDFGAQGSTAIQTPAFDQLAEEGTLFTQHYAGSAVCAPTRCVLMTGLHTGHCSRRDNQATAHKDELPSVLGKKEGGLVFLEQKDFTIAKVLKEAGYETAGIGKWSLGNSFTAGQPDNQGFDFFFGYLDQTHAHDHYSSFLWRNGDYPVIENTRGAKDAYVPDLMEAEALKFLRQPHRRPFFLYLPFTLPHGDFVIPSGDPAVALYADKPWPEKVKVYAAMLTRVDRTVGEILNVLNEQGIADKTIVFYTSDNGPAAKEFVNTLNSSGDLRGLKRQLYEGGIRAPMVVRWPGHVPAGRVDSTVWGMVDVYPTLCELAGVKPPKGLDGVSVVPLLTGETQQPHEFLYWEIHHPFHQAVRLGDWKGVRYGIEDPVELYDLANDPSEEIDQTIAMPDIAAQIAEIMDREHTESRYYPAVKHQKAKPEKDDETAE